MKLKKYELEAFIEFLDSLKLDRTASRMRTRMKNVLLEKYQPYIEELKEINFHYVAKDEQGNPLTEEGKYVFTDNGARLKELWEVGTEEVVIEQTAENNNMLLSVKDSVLYRSPNEYSGKAADEFDRFCEIVEQIEGPSSE